MKKQAHVQATSSESHPESGYQDNSELASLTKAQQAEREWLLKANYLLESGSERLNSSHRIALKTEELGSVILCNLRGQREQIERG
jgi:vesicle transport through interaction with t-SNAREs protein 1